VKKDFLEIKIGIGLGAAKFGMTRKEVHSLLGEPDDKDISSYTDGNDNLFHWESWDYFDSALSLSFDEEDEWRLVTIEIDSKDYIFENQNLIGKSKNELLTILEDKKIKDVIIEVDSTNEPPLCTLISSECLGINFWFEENSLTEVQWSPLLTDEENIKWPE